MKKFTVCPGTLRVGHTSYSTTCLRKLFNGHKVSPFLPYNAPFSNTEKDEDFINNRKQISISGVQEKFSLIQEKNTLRLVEDGEQGTHILKPIPQFGKYANQMPANEHLTMQIAQQLFAIDTAYNAMIFFKDGEAAYITRRFDLSKDGSKWAQEDFASLAQRSPEIDGEDYKYLGNYTQLFDLLKKYVPAYPIEALKLYKLILFNYFFSNGDAHLKNFSLLESNQSDFRLSPAYDLLNSRIHIVDKDFALKDGLLPRSISQGNVVKQFYELGKIAGMRSHQIDKAMKAFLAKNEQVEEMVNRSFLSDKVKRTYLQAYQTRYNRVVKSVSL